MVNLLLGFMTACWLFTVGAGVYGFWRYAYKPFEALRTTSKALHELLASERQERLNLADWIKAELGLRQALTRTDEDVARLEAQATARNVWGGRG